MHCDAQQRTCVKQHCGTVCHFCVLFVSISRAVCSLCYGITLKDTVLAEQDGIVQDGVMAARTTVTYGCELRFNGAHIDLYWFMLIISLMCNVAIMNLSFTLKT